MKPPFKLPVRIEDDGYIVAADCELIITNYDATPEELEAIVTCINGFHEAIALLEQALPIVDAHRNYALGEGDITASGIRSLLEKLK